MASKIVITGGAGLVGQNLVAKLKQRGYTRIVSIDKAANNSKILREQHPDIEVIVADLAREDGWQHALADYDALVHGHAQIGGLVPQEFVDNNNLASERVMAAAKAHAVPYIVNIPYDLFALLLRIYGLFSKNPPFTEKQLKALSTPDVFEIIDWPGIFGVRATPLDEALKETFGHPVYSKIALQF